MTPAKMFSSFGNDQRVSFSKGDEITTQTCKAVFEYGFFLGLHWWSKTSLGTFISYILIDLKPKKV